MLPGFGFGDTGLHCDKAVGNNRDRINVTVDQEFSKLWMIAWPLSAEPDLDTCSVSRLYNATDHPFDRIVLLFKGTCKQLGISVHTKGQLGQVVGANRKSVEPLAKASAKMTLEGTSHIT